jgi:hypothetical protein
VCYMCALRTDYVAGVSNEDGDGAGTGDLAWLRVGRGCMYHLASKGQKGLGRWKRSVLTGSGLAFLSVHHRAEHTSDTVRAAEVVVFG